MDGFDLGFGILFPAVRGKADRDAMANSVAPVRDGNETWLVMGGGGLLAAFPAACAAILPALHMPVVPMLPAPVFRGASLWRFRAETGAARRARGAVRAEAGRSGAGCRTTGCRSFARRGCSCCPARAWALSMWPLIVPPGIAIWDAAAAPSSQAFLLAGAAVPIPVVPAYAGHACWLFRGKVRADAGCH